MHSSYLYTVPKQNIASASICFVWKTFVLLDLMCFLLNSKVGTDKPHSLSTLLNFPIRSFYSLYSCILDLVSWILYPGSCILDPVSWILYPGSCILDPGSCILDLVSWILYPGSCIPALVSWSRILYNVPCILNLLSCILNQECFIQIFL